MSIKKVLNSKTLYFVLLGIVALEIIGAAFSIAFASEAPQRDAAISNLFLALLTAFLFSLPYLIESRFKLDIPSYLKIVVLLFLFAALILGNIHNFLENVNGYDKFLHIISGVLISVIGFEIVHYFNEARETPIKLSPGMVSLFAFTFSMTLLVLWEFYEFFVDTLAYHINNETERNMQRYQWIYEGNYFPQDYGLIDTMLDLLVGFSGAAIVSFIGWRILLKKNLVQDNPVTSKNNERD
ncbi:MAG: hypothetical protein K9L64_00625 [Candidatus Izimaplasma sp.]|nr:hypothetical protein [Candidatus Izimaplasma bacterium]